MKKTLFILFISVFSSAVFGQSERKCLFDQKILEIAQNEDFIKTQMMLDSISNSSTGNKTETVFSVPVVVHVIYKNNSENISLTQIQSQIDVLNEDYRKLNADTSNVEAGFSKADVKIEFCLARRDPQNNETNGITRTPTNIDNIGLTDEYYQVAPIWNRDFYLNIWVCDLGNFSAGFAYSPGANPSYDGVVIHYSNFGRVGNVQNNYDLGRTATHEVGHWFNLIHPWGRSQSCSDDDQINDTPLQSAIYQECPNPPKSSCGSKDMLSNFMGYVYDRCMGNFTEGQKERMRLAIVNSRTSLILSKGCLPVGIEEKGLNELVKMGPNPSSGVFKVLSIQPDIIEGLAIKVFDISGKEVPIKTKRLSNGYQIQMSNSPNGLYFLKVSDKRETVTKKLIIQHR